MDNIAEEAVVQRLKVVRVALFLGGLAGVEVAELPRRHAVFIGVSAAGVEHGIPVALVGCGDKIFAVQREGVKRRVCREGCVDAVDVANRRMG